MFYVLCLISKAYLVFIYFPFLFSSEILYSIFFILYDGRIVLEALIGELLIDLVDDYLEEEVKYEIDDKESSLLVFSIFIFGLTY